MLNLGILPCLAVARQNGVHADLRERGDGVHAQRLVGAIALIHLLANLVEAIEETRIRIAELVDARLARERLAAGRRVFEHVVLDIASAKRSDATIEVCDPGLGHFPEEVRLTGAVVPDEQERGLAEVNREVFRVWH
jgi:hypothetical protein